MTRCESCFREFEGMVCPHCGGAQNGPHQLPVGTLLRDRYKLGRVLGQGGFGITYLGWDILMRRPVAVKEFYPRGTVYRKTTVSYRVECTEDTEITHYEYSRERFLREASALVDFRDIPEVVDILDFVKENNTAYIIMEFVRGVDMAKYIQMKGGRLSVEETFRILKPVMEALAKVHKGGIVHRDISPDNIILDPMGGAKLLDFGAVRSVENPDVDKELNKSTEAILKQGFAPLEQYNTRGSLGPWTDEYAMCATVWYCLTGRVPEEASIRVSEGIDPDWSSIEGLPIHQQKALAKGFSCRAKDRYKGIDELLADLFPEGAEEIPVSVPVKTKAVPVTVPEKTKEVPVYIPEETKAVPVKVPKKRGKGAWIAAAAAVLAVIVAVAVFLPKGTKDEPNGPILQEPLPDDTAPVELQTRPTETEETEPPTTEPLSPEEEAYLQAEALLEEGKLGEAAIAFGKLSGFSDARERSFAIWEQITERDTITTESYHTVGLKADGTVVAVGWNSYGRCDVEGWTDVVAIAAGYDHTVGLRADGTVVAVGYNDDGRCDVSGWTDVVAIAAGGFHTVGLRADGTVVAGGDNDFGQCDVGGWTDIVAISAGNLTRDDNDDYWTYVGYTVGLRTDGTVVAVGYNGYGQCNVSGWTDVVAIAAGSNHTVGLRADGTVVAVGAGGSGQCDVSGWTDVVAIAAGGSHTVGLRADGTVVAVGANLNGRLNVSGWTDIRQPYERVPFR